MTTPARSTGSYAPPLRPPTSRARPASHPVTLWHDGHLDILVEGTLWHLRGATMEPHVLPDTAPHACDPDHECGGHAADHVHGPGCGHPAVPHGDHVCYLVGSHLHHPHAGHCDHHGTVRLGDTEEWSVD